MTILEQFIQDTKNQTRALHSIYWRAKFLTSEWYGHDLANNGIPNTSSIVGNSGFTGIELTNIIVRCLELITDMETNNNAKLNTIIAVSDLSLPGPS
jgi:hypothetical protein